jgi:NAD(P)-dependent dehydrogenase (short-subunit alcohol dehydrogenase family)
MEKEGRKILEGEVAIITGAANGIGRGIALSFANAGADIVVADFNAEAGARTVAEIEKKGRKALLVETDVRKDADLDRMVDATLNQFGRIDILVNNASLCPVVAWDDVTITNWNQILAVNLTGMLLCTQSVIPLMRKQQFGRIVFISSEAAFNGSYTAHVAYGVTKAGELALMKSVAKAFAHDNILANAITCGPVDTPLGHSLGADFWAESDKRTLLKRHAAAHEIADAVLFLVSNRSTYITGQVLRVNGGMNLT